MDVPRVCRIGFDNTSVTLDRLLLLSFATIAFKSVVFPEPLGPVTIPIVLKGISK